MWAGEGSRIMVWSEERVGGWVGVYLRIARPTAASAMSMASRLT